MDTPQLYLELQECSDCLMQAIDSERKTHSAHGRKARNWLARLQATRREVQNAAEYYATALQRYRTSMLSELMASESTRPALRARKHCSQRGARGRTANASFGRGFSKHQ
jgi:hypothetical protein